MKFSVIVPIYNVESYLNECLSSLQKQDWEDYEVICINDGSTDGSRAILSEWVSKLPQIKIVDRENGGLSAARNSGLDVATGEYILFVDSDDWVEPFMLNRLFTEIDGSDIICFACRETVGGAFDTLTTEQTDGWNYYNRHALESRKVPFVCVWQRCYRREFLLENHLRFREGILHEDNEFTPKVCLKARNIKVIPEVLYNYRVRSGSIMTSRGLKSKKSLILIANELAELFTNETDVDKTVIYQSLTQYYQMAFIHSTCEEDQHLLELMDWQHYHLVSRTKLRHRINYSLLRLSPSLFRWVYRTQ